MFCPKCGTENDDNAKFCKGCGASLNSSPNIETKKVENSSNNKLIIAITAIICVCIIFGALFMVLGNDSGDAVVTANNSSNNVESNDSSTNMNADTSSDNEDRYENFSESEYPKSSYKVNDFYTAHTPEDAKQEMFNQADVNGDGVLTGDEIKEMDYLLKHSEYTYNGPEYDTASSSSSSSEKHWYGQCTTHGWVMLDDDQHCPYCIEEGLDPRVLKNSKVYE